MDAVAWQTMEIHGSTTAQTFLRNCSLYSPDVGFGFGFVMVEKNFRPNPKELKIVFLCFKAKPLKGTEGQMAS